VIGLFTIGNEKVLVFLEVHLFYLARVPRHDIDNVVTPSELHQLKFLESLATKSCTPICGNLFAGREKPFTRDGRGLTGEDVKGDSSKRWVDRVIILEM
jgi:hypothetical protein